ncbi:MAG: hypothetical protein IT245_04820 [Bacteroidia bacterium]|nr:hypothetical protein [Bacteroidia bacterium]
MKTRIIFLLFIIHTCTVNAQFFTHLTPAQSIKLLNPAYVANDSTFEFSVNRYQSNYSSRNLGKTIIISFSDSQSIYYFNQKKVMDFTQAYFSKGFKLFKTVNTGLMLSYERENVDEYVLRNVLSLSNAYYLNTDIGRVSIGVSVKGVFDKPNTAVRFQDNFNVNYGTYHVKNSYVNSSLGLSFTSLDQSFSFGLSVLNLAYQNSYSSFPFASNKGPLFPMTFSFVMIDNRRTYCAHAFYDYSISKKLVLKNDFRAIKIEKGIDAFPEYYGCMQLKSSVEYKNLGLGLHYFNTTNFDQSGGGLMLMFKVLGLNFHYTYRQFLNKLATVSGGEHEFGFRINR